jgi:putative PIN family toxin of toxin-antitoxin system
VSTFFIVDTNVVVAGLLTSHVESPVAQILNGMLSAEFPFVLSEALLSEYRTVLLRPKLCKLHGLTEAEVDDLLTGIVRDAIVLKPVAPRSGATAPDPGDQFLWELLATRADLILVTGDKLLLQDLAMRPRVMTPQEFTAALSH